MYKNILILGSNKSGKTTLARKINDKYGYNIISLDNIINAFMKTFPKSDNDETYDEYITNYINFYIDELSNDSYFQNGKKYVIEGNVPNVESTINNLNKDTTTIITLVYDDLDENKFFEDIRKYETEFDWTKYLRDDLLLFEIKKYIKENKKISEVVTKLGVNKYNISSNRERILNDITDRMKEETSYDFSYTKKLTNDN